MLTEGIAPVKVPGGTTSWLQWIDTDVAHLFRSNQQRHYFDRTIVAIKRSSKQRRHLLVLLVAEAWEQTMETADVKRAFERLGYLDPTKARLRVNFSYTFARKSVTTNEPPQNLFQKGLEAERQLQKRKGNTTKVSGQRTLDHFLLPKPPPPVNQAA